MYICFLLFLLLLLFLLFLPGTRADYIRRLELLKRGMWFDRGTRAVFVEVSLYNQVIGLIDVIGL